MLPFIGMASKVILHVSQSRKGFIAVIECADKRLLSSVNSNVGYEVPLFGKCLPTVFVLADKWFVSSLINILV